MCVQTNIPSKHPPPRRTTDTRGHNLRTQVNGHKPRKNHIYSSPTFIYFRKLRCYINVVFSGNSNVMIPPGYAQKEKRKSGVYQTQRVNGDRRQTGKNMDVGCKERKCPVLYALKPGQRARRTRVFAGLLATVNPFLRPLIHGPREHLAIRCTAFSYIPRARAYLLIENQYYLINLIILLYGEFHGRTLL